MTAARAPFRIPRAAVVAVTVLALAATAHWLAGGELPAFPVMTALTAVVVLSAVLLAGRKMTAPFWPHIWGASQTALHLAFSALPGSGTPKPDLAHHPGMAAGPGIGGAVVPHEHLSADVSPGMLGAHVVAILAGSSDGAGRIGVMGFGRLAASPASNAEPIRDQSMSVHCRLGDADRSSAIQVPGTAAVARTAWARSRRHALSIFSGTPGVHRAL